MHLCDVLDPQFCRSGIDRFRIDCLMLPGTVSNCVYVSTISPAPEKQPRALTRRFEREFDRENLGLFRWIKQGWTLNREGRGRYT